MVSSGSYGSEWKLVIWVQGLVCFAMWIGYGYFQSRQAARLKQWIFAMPRSQRGITGAALFVFGVALLLIGLMTILRMGGFTSDGMTAIGWMCVTALGLAFVHAQMLGTAMLVSLVVPTVTIDAAPTSTNKITEDSDPT